MLGHSAANYSTSQWSVVDLFSGAGGFSCGFHLHPKFKVAAAVDIELGKPSLGPGALGCNGTYEANIGVSPLPLDLATIEPSTLAARLAEHVSSAPEVLIVCPPCTGLTRMLPKNHREDDPRNALIDRTAHFVSALRPKIVLMENARELVTGRFAHHFKGVREDLESLGYTVHADVYRFDQFGLPQVRERAVVVAAAPGLVLRCLGDLWDGYTVSAEAVAVRRAIEHFPKLVAGERDSNDELHTSPAATDHTLARLQAIPHDGGSWRDLVGTEHEHLLIPSMRRAIASGKSGRYSDVYGRMAWDQPAPTIKRECSHTGNGRYAHPEQDRLCSIREMAVLQGFPATYTFKARGRNNMYRHIGNAVPPMIAFQLASACAWILSGKRPKPSEWVMPGGHLAEDDIRVCETPGELTVSKKFDVV